MKVERFTRLSTQVDTLDEALVFAVQTIAHEQIEMPNISIEPTWRYALDSTGDDGINTGEGRPCFSVSVCGTVTT